MFFRINIGIWTITQIYLSFVWKGNLDSTGCVKIKLKPAKTLAILSDSPLTQRFNWASPYDRESNEGCTKVTCHLGCVILASSTAKVHFLIVQPLWAWILNWINLNIHTHLKYILYFFILYWMITNTKIKSIWINTYSKPSE